jgi:protocatechuate 3,4-dioxygenase beta subunit
MMNGGVKTDEQGHYSIGWQPRQMGIQNVKYFVIARQLERNFAAAEEISAGKTNVDLHLKRGIVISGIVQGPDGAPLDHASVNLTFMAGSYGGQLDQQPARTDANGAFTIATLPAGQRYNLNATASGYGTALKTAMPTETQANRELPPFKLKRADRLLAGRVVGPDNKPVSGAQVQINGTGQPYGNTRSDAEGHFVFKQVCEGPINIFAYSQSMNNNGQIIPGQVQTFGGNTNVLIKIGVNQPGIAQVPQRLTPVKQQPWTWRAVAMWFVRHPAAIIVAAALQLTALAGAAGGIVWHIRKSSA